MHDEPFLPGAASDQPNSDHQSDTQLPFDSIDGRLFDGLGQPRALVTRPTHPSTGGSFEGELKARSLIRELSETLRLDSDTDAALTRRHQAALRSRRRFENATDDDVETLLATRCNLKLVR